MSQPTQHLQTVQQIFSDKVLQIPDYQRGYAWDERHWKDLIEDIEYLDINQEHYTGTLVISQSNGEPVMDESGNNLKVYDVVDGQQRMTSICILLKSIQLYIKNKLKKEELSEGIKKNYLILKTLEGDEICKLKLNKDTDEYYRNNIILIENSISIDGPKIKSHERLLGAKNYFSKYIEAQIELLGQDFDKWLLELYKKVTTKFILTVYQVPEPKDVGIIFEVMNNRGKPLTELEKVKNYLLYVASKINLKKAHQLYGKINDSWKKIFESLMESDASSPDYEDQFLRANWILAYDYNLKNWNGSKTIKDRFDLKKYKNRQSELLEDLIKYVETLNASIPAYCDIITPMRTNSFNNFPNNEKDIARKKAEKISRLGTIASFIPLLMGLRIRFSNNPQLYIDFLVVCEIFSFRVYRLAGKRANAGQSTIFGYSNQLFAQTLEPSVILTNLKLLSHYYCSNEVFKKELDKGGWYNWFGIKYLLYEYEEFLANGSPVRLPWEDFLASDKKDSIEHILPQTPTDIYWTSHWSPTEIEKGLHDIGNLSLTFDNSSYNNKPFKLKKGSPGDSTPCYANSNLFMERDLAKYKEWTFTELTERRKEILDWISQRWAMELPQTSPQNLNVDESDD